MPSRAFFDRDVETVARELLGATLLFGGAGGQIVETEAYHPNDAASHSFIGQTPRNRVMFGPPAHYYVYRIYGVHWCLNIVCQAGCAVLIRALEPTIGVEIMAERRNTAVLRSLCSGPGKLCQALAITGSQNGLAVATPPFSLGLASHAGAISVGPRIGITKAAATPWRFGVAGSEFLSRPFPSAASKADLPPQTVSFAGKVG